jgi:hypothetical protein
LKYLCSPEKGCFSCVALKRAVFCKRCYWFTGVWCQWSLPEILVAEAFLQTTWAICVWIFQGKFVSILIVDSEIFFRILYYFCHSRQLPWWSVFCCYLLFYRWDKSISFSRFKFKNCKLSHQTTLKFCIFKIKSAEI